jgi:hypothetical protein
MDYDHFSEFIDRFATLPSSPSEVRSWSHGREATDRRPDDAKPRDLGRDGGHEIWYRVFQRDAGVVRRGKLLCVDLGGFIRKMAQPVCDGRDINEGLIRPHGTYDSVRRFDGGYIRGSGLLC